MVGERRIRSEASAEASVECIRVRMPERVTEKGSANLPRRKSKGSAARMIRGGLVGPKGSARARADGEQVDIPVLHRTV